MAGQELTYRAPDVQPPPSRGGLPLGWRLALWTSAIVTIVMGGITLVQQLRRVEERRISEEVRLRKSLLPLASALEAATTAESARAELLRFHDAYQKSGFHAHHLLLRDANDALVLTTFTDGGMDASTPLISATVPVTTVALAGGEGALTVFEDGSEHHEVIAGMWESWAIHLLVTVLAILAFLQPTIRFLVTRPMERLLDGVRKMEMGYWGELAVPSGAWEVRWLAWRFRSMGNELQRTVQHLVAAERRAWRRPASGDDTEEVVEARADVDADRVEREAAPTSTRLERICRRLESASPDDSAVMALAQRAGERYAAEAERMGDIALKSRLEDAALKILEPDAFRQLERRLAALKTSQAPWVEARKADIRAALQREGVSCRAIQHRVKHTAGVWAKMESKGLELEQVHDLYAFRLVVPTESDCYWALGVIHELFKPVVGRFKDYIAAPKRNGYQSVHTSVRSSEEGAPVFEVQIRSMAMHRYAEHGLAAHSQYKTTVPTRSPRAPRLVATLRRALRLVRRQQT